MSAEAVDIETGEIITETDARASVDRARHHGRISFEEITWQVEHRVWELLGYDSWDAMRATEYADLRAVVPRADRPELTARMRSSGLTQQQIADTLGVSRNSVIKDLNAQSEHSESEAITNSRGQQRPTNYQRPERRRPKPMPPPLPPEDTPELRQRDSRSLLRRIVDMVALDGRALDPDAWARQIGDMDDELTDLISRAEVSGRVLLALAERKRS